MKKTWSGLSLKGDAEEVAATIAVEYLPGKGKSNQRIDEFFPGNKLPEFRLMIIIIKKSPVKKYREMVDKKSIRNNLFQGGNR